MKLLLIRHATSEKNRDNRIGSSSNDFALTRIGFSDALKLGNILYTNNLIPDALYCSASEAPYQTALAIGRIINQTPVVLSNFHAINLGIISGLSFSEIEDQYPAIWAQMNAYMQNQLHPKFFRIPEAESNLEFENRIRVILMNLLRSSLERICIIAHRSVITIIINICTNVPHTADEGHFRFLEIPPLSLSLVSIEKELLSSDVNFIGIQFDDTKLPKLLVDFYIR